MTFFALLLQNTDRYMFNVQENQNNVILTFNWQMLYSNCVFMYLHRKTFRCLTLVINLFAQRL